MFLQTNFSTKKKVPLDKFFNKEKCSFRNKKISFANKKSLFTNKKFPKQIFPSRQKILPHKKIFIHRKKFPFTNKKTIFLITVNKDAGYSIIEKDIFLPLSLLFRHAPIFRWDHNYPRESSAKNTNETHSPVIRSQNRRVRQIL